MPLIRILLRWLIFPLGAHYKPAPDDLGHRVVRAIIEPQRELRDSLTREIYVSHERDDPTGLLEVALAKVVAAEDAERKLESAIRAGDVQRYHGRDWIGEAENKGILTKAEADALREVEDLTARVIAVDDFDPEEVRPNYIGRGHNAHAANPASAN